MSSLTPREIDLLNAVAAASDVDPGYAMQLPMHMSKLIGSNFVVKNDKIVEGGKYAYRITDAGREELASVSTVADAPAVAQAVMPATTDAVTRTRATRVSLGTIELEDDVPLPEKTTVRTAGQNEVYPFSTMDVGRSFFLPNSAERPDAVKSIASAVAAASRRHEPKVFVAHPFTQPSGIKGVRVWRKDDLSESDLAALKDRRAARAPRSSSKVVSEAPQGLVVTSPAAASAGAAPWSSDTDAE